MFIKRFIKRYITNEELEVSHRLMNIILMVGILVLPVCIIFDVALGSVSGTFVPLMILFTVFMISFFIANFKHRANIAGIILTVTANDILVPYLYFMGGGRSSSMPCWLILASVFSWLLVKGWPCIAIFISNIIVYAAAFYVEYEFPEYVERLPDEESEIIDTVFGIYLIIMMIGIIFKFQNRLYEKKKKELEEKEKELTETNIKLEKMSDAKSFFLASMSHEIRTPINAIVGMNEMILRDSKEDSVVEYAESIEHASTTLLSLVNDILDFSKIEAGLLEIIPDNYDTYYILNDCYSMLEMRAFQKGLKLKLENDPALPSKLYGDEKRIRQIMINLMTNAVKYTDNGTITIRAGFSRLSDDEILFIISVSDTGRGMSEEGMQHLFDSYQRIDEKKNRNIEGTGLGLAITKQLIDLMHGDITVKSTLGEGSTFTISIPQKIVSDVPMGSFASRRNLDPSSPAKHGVGFRAPDAKILITDDIAMNLKVLTMLLKDTRMQMDTAKSGKECIEKYEEKHYDLVFLDHMMPEMDGLETLKILTCTDRYLREHTPIIALTANAMAGADKIYLDAGFDDYLTKPVKSADLEEMILKHLPDNVNIIRQ
ncbi:MAG: response regulator [Lachnospiraceae bacterium]|nr:response regulator [Lachnospiraceae bacterium]